MTRSGFARRIAVLLTVSAAVTLAACSGSDATTSTTEPSERPARRAVEIGPGTTKSPPAVALIDAEPAAEPDWVAEVPGPEVPTAGPIQLAAALDAAASLGLRAPTFGRPSTTTTTRRGAESSAFARGSYRGTMTMKLAYHNYCVTRDGNLAFAGSRTYRSDAEVFINDRAEDEGVAERSPFNLIMTSESGVEGTLVVASATVVSETRGGRTALFDYWRIREQNGRIDGTLTDRWPGVALNTITTEQPLVPCTPGFSLAVPSQLMEGARITGTGNGRTLDLKIVGQSLDRERRFQATISVTRTRT